MRRRWPWIVVALAVCVTSVAAPSGDEVIARALAFVQEARERAGAPPLRRREDLDRVAAARLRALDVRPGGVRPELETTEKLRVLMDAEGLFRFREVYEYFDVRRGHTRGQTFARWWRTRPEAWRRAMDPEMDAIGLATARTDDHWTILLAVLLDEAEPLDVTAMADRAFRRVNDFRREYGLPPFAVEEAIAGVLEIDQGFERDVSVVGARRTVSLRVKYRGPGDPVDYAVDFWRERPELLDPAFTEGAVGVKEGTGGEVRFRLVLVQPAE